MSNTLWNMDGNCQQKINLSSCCCCCCLKDIRRRRQRRQTTSNNNNKLKHYNICLWKAKDMAKEIIKRSTFKDANRSVFVYFIFYIFFRNHCNWYLLVKQTRWLKLLMFYTHPLCLPSFYVKLHKEGMQQSLIAL